MKIKIDEKVLAKAICLAMRLEGKKRTLAESMRRVRDPEYCLKAIQVQNVSLIYRTILAGRAAR